MTTGDHRQKVRDQNQVRTHAGFTGIRTRVGHKVGEDKTQRPHRTAHRLARQGKLGGCVGQRKAGEEGAAPTIPTWVPRTLPAFPVSWEEGLKLILIKGREQVPGNTWRSDTFREGTETADQAAMGSTGGLG